MKIEYEDNNQSILVCKDIDRESIDNLTLKMICNNKINGLAPVEYIKDDAGCELKYDIPGMIQADKLLNNGISKAVLLKLLSGILDSLSNMADYMIDIKKILLDTRYIFINENNDNVNLICVPIINMPENENIDIFLKKLMVNTTFNQAENCDYVAVIINFLNQSDSISLKEFKQLINRLSTESDSDNIHENKDNTNINKDSLESNIDVNKKVEQGFISAQQEIRTAYVPQSNQPVPSSQVQQNNMVELEKKENTDKISLGYLLRHYNAENKAKYKAQKKDKNNQQSQQVNNGKQPSFNPAGNSQELTSQQVQPQPSQRLAANQVTPQQPMRQVTPQQPVKRQTVIPQHMNVQPSAVPQNQPGGNFGETTVLSAAASSDTTVLNQSMLLNNSPYLIRKKTGERIQIDKPVFRLGKENSYVDYFIGDNSAISRSHANIITKENKYYIIDTNSTNHTFIEGQMIPPNRETEITSGQMIKLANEEFEFHIG